MHVDLGGAVEERATACALSLTAHEAGAQGEAAVDGHTRSLALQQVAGARDSAHAP